MRAPTMRPGSQFSATFDPDNKAPMLRNQMTKDAMHSLSGATRNRLIGAVAYSVAGLSVRSVLSVAAFMALCHVGSALSSRGRCRTIRPRRNACGCAHVHASGGRETACGPRCRAAIRHGIPRCCDNRVRPARARGGDRTGDSTTARHNRRAGELRSPASIRFSGECQLRYLGFHRALGSGVSLWPRRSPLWFAADLWSARGTGRQQVYGSHPG